MATEQAGIPRASAVAQQVHHAEAAAHAPHREPAPVAAAASLKPHIDLSALRGVGKIVGCLLRPYPIDDTDPRGSRRRIATAGAAVAAVVAASVVVRRAR